MNIEQGQSVRRRRYEAPLVARIIVDPMREMLADCTAAPGKNPPGSADCQADPVCCIPQS